jgi:hypothetical protein
LQPISRDGGKVITAAEREKTRWTDLSDIFNQALIMRMLLLLLPTFATNGGTKRLRPCRDPRTGTVSASSLLCKLSKTADPKEAPAWSNLHF